MGQLSFFLYFCTFWSLPLSTWLLLGICCAKALTKQEGPIVCWDAPFMNPFFMNFYQLPAAKNGLKNSASQQTFSPSYFDRALAVASELQRR